MIPYGLLLLLSFGSGWTFPNLSPDRMDFAPWKSIIADRDGLLTATLTSVGISLIVAVLATIMGLLIGRSLRHGAKLKGEGQFSDLVCTR